ncbi:MAG: DeoR/GlpR transcriptional regulator [Eubacterium sp.]|jgi:DeoR family fructose operon transcriptional repressor|nr:DeoR/GlpR transcriptional regulator [Eubacterium sp.]
MLTEERQQKILELVEQYKSVSTQSLMDELHISESTVRRDLNMLHEQGRLSKVRGGAMIKTRSYRTKDDEVSLRKSMYQDEKRKIARYAASLIEAEDFVYLDAGTTTELMIEYLTEQQVVFVTNAVGHAKRLSESGYTTYLLGGEFKASTEAVVGDEAVESLKKYNFTKGFFGVNGVSPEYGFSTPDVKEAMVKKTAMVSSAKRFVLCDPSKFSQISCVKFADFTNAVIITTEVAGEEYVHFKHIMEVNRL